MGVDSRHRRGSRVNRLRVVAHVFGNVLARKRSEEEEVVTPHGSGVIVGDSQALRRVLDQVQVAATGARVLLLGETGMGKELIASRIHDLSTRLFRIPAVRFVRGRQPILHRVRRRLVERRGPARTSGLG